MHFYRQKLACNGCSLAPATGSRPVDDWLSDAHYPAIRLPAVLPAEYRDGDRRCVTPHGDTVADCLDELTAGDPAASEPLRRAPPSPPPVAIPPSRSLCHARPQASQYTYPRPLS